MYVDSTSKDSPKLDKNDAEDYVRAVMAKAAERAVEYTYEWCPAGTDYEKRKKFWTYATDDFKSKVVRLAGKRLYNTMLAATGTNQNVKTGKNAITMSRSEEAIREAIQDRAALQSAEAFAPEPEPEPPKPDNGGMARINVDLGYPNMNAPSLARSQESEAFGEVVGKSLVTDLRKAFSSMVDRTNYVPPKREDLELFKAHGRVPDGYLDQDMVKAICPGCAKDMARERIPLIKATYFVQNVTERTAVDLYNNAHRFAEYLLKSEPDFVEELAALPEAADYDMTKAKSRQGLVKKTITNKAGKRQTVWVKPGKGVVADGVKVTSEKAGNGDPKHAKMMDEGIKEAKEEIALLKKTIRTGIAQTGKLKGKKLDASDIKIVKDHLRSVESDLEMYQSSKKRYGPKKAGKASWESMKPGKAKAKAFIKDYTSRGYTVSVDLLAKHLGSSRDVALEFLRSEGQKMQTGGGKKPRRSESTPVTPRENIQNVSTRLAGLKDGGSFKVGHFTLKKTGKKFQVIDPSGKVLKTFNVSYSAANYVFSDEIKKIQASTSKKLYGKGSDPTPIIGESLDLVDFIKAKSSATIKAWANKMKNEGGEHPHTWCVQKAQKFADDPNAFCASVHLQAYGMTPSQRKAQKKAK